VFEYFPGNYVWNLGVVATLNSGGLIDEVDRACRPIRDAAARGEDAGTPDFLRAWTALTDSLVAQAEAAEKAGHAKAPRPRTVSIPTAVSSNCSRRPSPSRTPGSPVSRSPTRARPSPPTSARLRPRTAARSRS